MRKNRDYNLKNDLNYLKELENQIENPCVCKRLFSRLEWYMIAADKCQKRYYLCSGISVIIPTIVLILNTNLAFLFIDNIVHIIVGILSGITSVASALNALMKWHDNWIRYRACTEKLKSEATLYIAGVGKYKNASKKDDLFIKYIEQISLTENQNWQESEKDTKQLQKTELES